MEGKGKIPEGFDFDCGLPQRAQPSEQAGQLSYFIRNSAQASEQDLEMLCEISDYICSEPTIPDSLTDSLGRDRKIFPILGKSVCRDTGV